MDDFNPLVLLIPLIAGFIGWFTNWLAVKATLYPVEFVGIPPAFGWQGVIPKNTDEMSQSFSKLIHDKLVDMEQIFADIDHDDNEELDKVVEDVSVEIIREFSTKIAPDSWARAREKLREYINMLVRRNVRRVTVEILDRMAAEAGDFIDIDKIAHEALVEDRALLGSVLMDVAGPEFKFIERSGLWFGFLFGIIQMGVWIVYPEGWVLPVAGFLVGYVTNWLAMNLIYEPREPVQIGPFVFQGVFIKRQKEVATHFANVIADRVLTAEKLVRHISQGPNRQRLLDILEGQVEESMKVYEKDAMVAMLADKEKLADAKADLLDRVRNTDMSDSSQIKTFADQSHRIRQQMEGNLGALDAQEFGGILRPVFQKDEWKLILAGGVIGTGIGALQVVVLFGGF
ncbi:MAG: hypothetical protein OES21_04195 [Myxococcales bacterium]|jgi:uncharacterized membrane protein YheB (UPF0754 family)|nr:hypothetical protein [Myxococcales bacterium]